MVRLFSLIPVFGAQTHLVDGAWGLVLASPRLEDTSSLLQVQGSLWHVRAARGAGVEDAWEALVGNDRFEAPPSLPPQLNGWPLLGDVWDEMKDAAHNLTDELGDLSAEVEQKVPNAAKGVGPAVRAVAAGLSIGLQTICKEMDLLLNETKKDKQTLATQLGANRTQQLTMRQLLEQFEALLDKLLGSASARWGNVQDAVDRAVTSLASGLEAGGQRHIAEALRLNMRVAQAQVDHWLRAISSAKEAVRGSGKIDIRDVKERMSRIQYELHQAMEHMSHFTTLFQQAFIDLIDTISSKLLWAVQYEGELDDVNVIEVFSMVQHEVTRVAWRTRSAARELMSGARMGLAAVATTANETLPPWTPVAIPLLSGSVQTSAAPRGLLFLAALAFTIAQR